MYSILRANPDSQFQTGKLLLRDSESKMFKTMMHSISLQLLVLF